jgi:hypothetical protein
MFSRRKRLARSYGRVKEGEDLTDSRARVRHDSRGLKKSLERKTGNKWRASLVSSIAFP